MAIINMRPNIWQLYFKRFGSCVYVIRMGQHNILVDTSSKDNEEELLHELKKLKIEPRDVHYVLLTHTHSDHIQNLDLFPNAKVISKENIKEFLLPRWRVIETPGHTKDSICFLHEEVLFSGDTIFNIGIGRTDFPESEPEKMRDSLDKLKKVNYEILAPGHV
jgi:glyoxylase-like metal-dependent hydrolase (beta-lactamase superfamily II)